MTLTAKHIEYANVCARLENAGFDGKEMAKQCGSFASNDLELVKLRGLYCRKGTCLGGITA